LFFNKLIAGGLATTDLAVPAHAGRFYHLQYKPWYRALGEPDHRRGDDGAGAVGVDVCGRGLLGVLGHDAE
jgi:hypothetical protein